MAVTAGGTPYVESSDLVANYPAVSEALAEHIDTKLTNTANTFTVASAGTVTLAGSAGANASLTLQSTVADSDGAGAGNLTFRNDGAMTIPAEKRVAVVATNLEGATVGNRGARMAFTVKLNGGAITERMRISNTGTISGTGPSLGDWVAYTPVLSGTGWAIGNGSASGGFCQIGKTVHFRIAITFGSTSTFGAGGLAVTYPTTSKSLNMAFQGFAFDASLSKYFTIPTIHASTTTMKPQAVQSAAGLIEEIISTKPFTWATSDQIFLNGTYEAA